MNENKNKSSPFDNGIPIQKSNYVIYTFTFIVCILLLIFTFITSSKYNQVKNETRSYINWQQSVQNLQLGSDYLTEQVRQFAITGNKVNVDLYFQEANINMRRESALQTINKELADSEAYKKLRIAMDTSVELMELEYYSMRLVIEAYGYDVSQYPQVLQDTKLTEADLILTKEQKI